MTSRYRSLHHISDTMIPWQTATPNAYSSANPNMILLVSNGTLLDSLYNVSTTSNLTRSDKDLTSVHDIEYDLSIRKAILYVQIVVGTLGAMLLFCYMFHARR